MKYNTSRKKMALPEYGRNVQSMVEYVAAVEDETLRTAMVQEMVKYLLSLEAGSQEKDLEHKVWDRIFVLSDFKLDVPSPYKKPEPEELTSKPQEIHYNNNDIALRHYGHFIVKMINNITRMEEGEEKRMAVEAVATQMKKLYLSWNRDNVEDEVISKNVDFLSSGTLDVGKYDIELPSTAAILNMDKKKPAKPNKQNAQRQNNGAKKKAKKANVQKNG